MHALWEERNGASAYCNLTAYLYVSGTKPA